MFRPNRVQNNPRTEATGQNATSHCLKFGTFAQPSLSTRDVDEIKFGTAGDFQLAPTGQGTT